MPLIIEQSTGNVPGHDLKLIRTGTGEDFTSDLSYGEEGEKTVADLLKLKGKLEVKKDRWTPISKNVCIERYGRVEWDTGRRRLSGINITKSDYWAYVVEGENYFTGFTSIQIFPVFKIKDIVRRWDEAHGVVIKENPTEAELESWKSITACGDNWQTRGSMIPLYLFYDTKKDWIELEREWKKKTEMDDE